MKKWYAALWALCMYSLAGAQQLTPLTENPVLKRHFQLADQLQPGIWRYNPGEGQEKNACPLTEAGVSYVEAGKRADQRIFVTPSSDTTAILLCDGCDMLQYGAAVIVKDSLYYTANADVLAGRDTLKVKLCKPDASVCYDSITYYFVAKRAGRNYFPPRVNIAQEQFVNLEADKTLLPGELACNTFVDCPDNYQGRAQRFWFTDYSTPDHRFVYEASRYAGVDSVCLALCDEYAVCDTFHYAIRISSDTVGLPFMDDFSYPGPLPSIDHWLDIDPFINTTMGEMPPSIGVATFDGIDGRGSAYGGQYGPSDYLTSRYLNLQGAGGNLTLTFWAQRRGLVDRPEIQDSLVLEFKNSFGIWQIALSLKGIPGSQTNDAPEPFRFYDVPVPQEFRYKGFQFRFRNYSDRLGINDNWHLDYVRLDAVNIDSIFSDIAFTQQPNFILKNYTSMPWRHFEGREAEELGDNIAAGIYNHAGQSLNASPSSVSLVELNSGFNVFGSAVTLFNGLEANIPNGEPVSRSYQLLDDPTGFPEVWPNYLLTMEGPTFDDADRLDFELKYTLNNTSQINQPGFEAVQRNDQVTQTTVFDNYFAYDDGTAEAGLVTSEGTQVAMKYTAGVDDSLRAVRIHFPHTSADVSDQTFRLRVWVGQLDNSPEYSMNLLPYYADSFFDTLQGFTTYPLVDANGNNAPMFIPAGDFYVGWQQITSCEFTRCVPIGYDKNRPNVKEFIFRNSGQGWEPLSEFTPGGALMIRPVVGGITPGATPVDEPTPETGFQWTIYPNPAADAVFVQLNDGLYEQFDFRLFNSNGQLVQQGPLSPQIPVTSLPNGVYWMAVRHRDTQQIEHRKLVIVH